MVDVPDAADDNSQAPDSELPADQTDPWTPPARATAVTVAEHPALTEFRARTRRASTIYAGVLVVILIVAFALVKLAYAHGELNKVSFTTAPSIAPPDGRTPSASLKLVWHNDETPAGGNPYDDGIVVTYQGHTVNGRDASTGAVRWHYTRSDETLCSVLQQDSSTIAIYRRGQNCDEVTGFVTATGEPKYYRTLKDDGTTDTTSLSNVVMTVGSTFVHEFDNAGGVDRWDWDAPSGCTVGRALAGDLGTLISLDCNGKHQLVLRDLYQNTTKFTVDTPTAMVPLTSSAFIGALEPSTGRVYNYSPKDGTATLAEKLDNLPASGYPRAAASLSTTDATQQQIEFVVVGKLIVFSPDGSVRWSADAIGQPALVTDAFVAVRTQTGPVVLHRVDAGQVQLTSNVAPVPDLLDQRISSVGTGLLFAGSGVSLYR